MNITPTPKIHPNPYKLLRLINPQLVYSDFSLFAKSQLSNFNCSIIFQYKQMLYKKKYIYENSINAAAEIPVCYTARIFAVIFVSVEIYFLNVEIFFRSFKEIRIITVF
jgi:hypothetical protein